MLFNSYDFLFLFLPVTLAGYFLLGRTRQSGLANVWLIVASLFFYAYWDWHFLPVLLVSMAGNYLLAGRIQASFAVGRGRACRRWFWLGLLFDLGTLGYYKYYNFFVQNLDHLGFGLPLLDIVLPLGISFFTITQLLYLYDSYKGVARDHDPVRYALFVSFFPHLLAGPILYHRQMMHQFADEKLRRFDWENVARGAVLFTIGLAKKCLIADTLAVYVNDGWAHLGELSLFTGWLVAIAYMLQLYFDFSGYSDMAIGIGRCLGFHFKENFNHPYCCNSISDFWRRWHMSLGSFFRDYVYIPMGGNRRHQAWNIFVVWFLTGMWHGASWNFIIWGVYFGFIVAVEKYTILRLKSRFFTPLLHVYSLILVVIGWGIFYFEDFSQMTVFFHSFFGLGETFTDFASQAAVMDKFWLFLFAIVLCMPVRKLIADTTDRLLKNHRILNHGAILVGRTVLSLVVLILSVALLVGATNNAFLYTRF